MDGVRIEAAHVADGIGLVDAFRAAGFDARLADRAGTWDVEVAGRLDEVAPLLRDWAATRGRDPLLAHANGCDYLFLNPRRVATRPGPARATRPGRPPARNARTAAAPRHRGACRSSRRA